MQQGRGDWDGLRETLAEENSTALQAVIWILGEVNTHQGGNGSFFLCTEIFICAY